MKGLVLITMVALMGCWTLLGAPENGAKRGVLEHINEIAAGAEHSCARNEDGQVWCWGSNIDGRLGGGNTNTSNSLVAVIDLPAVSEIAVGSNHSCARNEDGQVWCWGRNAEGQLGDGVVTCGENCSTNDSSRPVSVIAP